MAQVVIADAGPLIALSKLDCLHIIEALFGCVVIPEAVQQECLAKSGQDGQRIQQMIAAGSLQVWPPVNDISPVMLPRSLGEGEKAALTLAMQHKQSLLIVDDQLARRQAVKLGLAFIGLVRLQDIAEQHGLIKSAEQAVEMASQAGYRVSQTILQQVRSKPL